MAAAQRSAKQVDREYVGTQHILIELLARDGTTARKMLENLDLDVAALKTAAEALDPTPAPWGTTRKRSGARPRQKDIAYTSKTLSAFSAAVASESEFGGTVGTGQMLVALLDAKSPAGALMLHHGIDFDELRAALRDLYATQPDSFRRDEWT